MADRDAETVREALAGRQEAYAALVERHGTPVFNLLLRLVHDPAVAEELAQDTVMGVSESTARSHVHRARRRLADEMRRAGWGGATNGPGSRSTESNGS